ncbi:hypothetical protein ARMSODRAFT_1019789 [Armillaria solidipes]|uniref:ARM repeat-containing protein n=1 Tax=Armillaria solidipes TaxID=1076256 RepID=A0A2H3BWC3_9AGAR|nr:hypothetical protein ARMSODRAFT_1019789 [Armillaria solidipes]
MSAPNQTVLAKILHTLCQVSDTSLLSQSAVVSRQEDLKWELDYIAYLTHVMLYSPREDVHTKLNAGHQLKNNLDLIPHSTDGGVAYMKRVALLSMAEPSLRCLGVCIIISLLLEKGPAHWLEGIKFIVTMLNDADMVAQDTALNVMHTVCKQSPSGFDIIMDKLYLLRFLQLTKSLVKTVCSLSSMCLVFCVPAGICFALSNIYVFDIYLSRMGIDASTGVHCYLYKVLTDPHVFAPMGLGPSFKDLAPFMIDSVQSEDEQVALTVCMFWNSFIGVPHLAIQIHPWLESLMQSLLVCMIYSMDEIIWMENHDIQLACHDKHATDHSIGPDHGDDNMGQCSVPDDAREAYNTSLTDNNTEQNAGNFWMRRTCAALTLDTMGITFQEEILPVLMGPIKENMKCADW